MFGDILGQGGSLGLWLFRASFRRLAELHVGAEAAVGQIDVLLTLWIVSEELCTLLRLLEHLHCLVDGQVGRRHVVRNRSANRFIFGVLEVEGRGRIAPPA